MKPGTILLIRSKGFLPDQIRLHMAILAKYRKLKPSPYNHAETAILYEGRMMSVGARGGGAEMTPLDEYLAAHPHYVALEPIIPLNDIDISRQEKYAREVCFMAKRPYQRGMFLAWIAKLKTGLTLGNQTDRKVYCYELAARFAALVGRYDKEIKLVSIYDLLNNRHYKEVHNDKT